MSKLDIETQLENMSPEKRQRFLKFLREKISQKKNTTKITPDILYPLSFAQQQIWISQEISQNKLIYNLQTTWKIVGELKINKLEKCINTIIQRQDSLRTIFVKKDKRIYQKSNST